MGVFLAVLIVTALLVTAVKNAHSDHQYARQGLVPPRLERRWGPDEGRARASRYGFRDHVGDNLSDMWARRTDAVRAARDERDRQRAERGEQWLPWWAWRRRYRRARTNWRRTRQAARDGADRAQPHSSGTTGPDPTTRPTPDPPPPPSPDPPPTPTLDNTPPPPEDTTADRPANPDPTGPGTPPPSNGGPPMGQPTGEVVNYEQAIAHHDKMDQEFQRLIDKAITARLKIDEAEAAVEAMQADHMPTQTAAQTASDHYAAANVDSQTQAHAGETTDALSAVAITQMYDGMEAVKQEIAAALAKYEAGRAANQAAKANLVRRYADAQDTVNSDLSGDSRFLNSGGGSRPGQRYPGEDPNFTPTPRPEPAAAR